MTSGLLNAYQSIFGLADYEPALAKARYTKAQVRTMIQAAIDNPVNVRHVHSLAEVEREAGHLNTLYYQAEQAEADRKAAASRQADDIPLDFHQPDPGEVGHQDQAPGQAPRDRRSE